MNCEINEDLVGCRIVVLTSSGELEGVVRSVSSGTLSLVNGVLVSTNTPLPSLYRLLRKDIISIQTVGEKAATPPRKQIQAPKVVQKPAPSTSKRVQSVMMHKQIPEHINRLDNNIQNDVLTNKVPLTRDGVDVVKLNLPDYMIIDKIDDLFYKVIAALRNESVVGMSMEGIRVGRFGVVCWIGLATNDRVFLFDICSLGPVSFDEGLKAILVDPRKIKVIHDCRFVADALLHKYGVRIDNVFDTQVAASVVDCRKFGSFNRFVPPLTRCLTDFMNFTKESMFHPRIREGFEKEDESKWSQRPLPPHLVEGAVFNVCHLKQLRLVLMETLMKEVTKGTQLYLKEVTDLPDDCVAEKYVIAHNIPTSFENLIPSRRYKNGATFQSNVPAQGCDPYTTFTRHIAHVNKS